MGYGKFWSGHGLTGRTVSYGFVFPDGISKYLAEIFPALSNYISVSAVEFLKCVGQIINFVTLRQKSCHKGPVA